MTRIKPKSNYTLILKVKNGEDLGVLECFGVDDWTLLKPFIVIYAGQVDNIELTESQVE